VVVWVLAFFPAFLNSFKKLFDPVVVVGSLISFILFSITCTFYIKAFRALHLYTVQVHAQQPNPLPGNFDVVRYKRTLKTMLVVLGCFLLCYVPIIFSLASMVFGVRKEKEWLIFFFLTLTAMGLNSSINPVIYFVRFTDIRNACREMLRNLVH
jgi:hypothetical protein